jgi:hypothetical protein
VDKRKRIHQYLLRPVDAATKPPYPPYILSFCYLEATDIEQDMHAYGRSTIMEKILSEKKAGACQCVTKNPKNR